MNGLDYNISGLPNGLLINDLELTGTPEQAGTFSVLVKGVNRFGEANNSFTIHVAPGNPSIATLPSTQVGSSSALLHADINSTGGEDANVSFVFGTASDDLSSTSQIVSSSETGKISVLLTGLDPNETYYFRARIQNSLTSEEGTDNYSFTTFNQGISPLVQVGPASNITASGATLTYNLISYDTNAPEITLFWGPVDHGELAGLWSFSHNLGAVSETGTGTHTISGLSPGETFYYRVRAKTANHTKWSESAGSLRTIGLANVQVLPAINQTVQSATIRGNVLSDGGESTEVFLQQPLNSNGLLAHWPFNEGEGTKTSESTGFTEEAQLRGGVTWIPSAKEELGSALSLWGEEQSYLDLGSFNLGGGAMILHRLVQTKKSGRWNKGA